MGTPDRDGPGGFSKAGHEAVPAQALAAIIGRSVREKGCSMFFSVIDPCSGSVRQAGLSEGAVMAGLVGALGASDFGHRVLCLLAPLVRMGSWSVYTLEDGRPPEFLMASTVGRSDVTGECWRVYRDSGLYRSDRSFDRARQVLSRQAGLVLSHTQASDMPAAHRTAIYERYRLQERLSLIASRDDHGILALNFYRYADQAAFTVAESRALETIAPVLVASVLKHQAWTASSAGAAWTSAAALLRERYPRLTERELEVCAGLLKGWTFDGIAAHLGVSASTVKTYRDRAFRTLDIHHRHQLYALCAGVCSFH